MSGMGCTENVEFSSTDGSSVIHATIWWPALDLKETPRGVVLLVHGMAEHISRYDEFARHLCGHGFVVAGHDQLGHGRSCDPSRWGCLPLANGGELLIGDVAKLRASMDERVSPELPRFVFGHSLGSFITRCYISRQGEGLAGAVMCGTGTVTAGLARATRGICKAVALVRGEDHRSAFVDSLGVGAYAKAIADRRTDLDWLSYDRDNVDCYIADEACGFTFSVGGYATVGALAGEACSASCAAKVPHDLPLLYIAGDGDPVGGNGAGVRAAAQLARDAGSTDVTCTIYEHMRHEILNEADRGRVYDDVVSWLMAHMPHET
ncbi:alpha/beta fold hydrolase [Olsenella massiliensis]|uniref:alpha/beta fold hydrolase n=1 Tax=Olsenella massiliensis TaxID=1622075 RepID=UPI00071CAE6F|nr:alpha/beta hydrolase [Olsenella massiliensis]